MAKARTPSEPTPPPALTEPVESARAKIRDRITRGDEIRSRSIQVDDDAYLYNKDLTKWDEYNETLMRTLFTGNETFDNYRWGTIAPSASGHETYMAEYRRRVGSLNDKIAFLESLFERVEAMPLAPGVEPAPRPRRSEEGPLLFLSHTTHDADLAAFLEEILRASIKGVRVFRTSRQGQLTAGQGWFEEIRQNLMHADLYVVLVTPRSHDRWWVLFEAGAALRSGRMSVPVLAGGLTPSAVNEPLRFLTLRNLEVETEAQQALLDLGGSLGDTTAFVARVKQLGEVGRVAAARHEGFAFIDFSSAVYAWDGPFPELKDGVSTVPEPAGLADALKAQGLEVTAGILEDPIEGAWGFVPLYHLKDWRYKSRVMRSSDRQVLWVRRPAPGQGDPFEGWKGVTVDGRYFAWEGPGLHSLTDQPGVPATESAINAIKGRGLNVSFGTRDKLRDHLARGAKQVFETDRRRWRKELLYDADGSQVLLTKEGTG